MSLGGSTGRPGQRGCDSSRRAAIPCVPCSFQTGETLGASSAHGSSTKTRFITVYDPRHHRSIRSSAARAKRQIRSRTFTEGTTSPCIRTPPSSAHTQTETLGQNEEKTFTQSEESLRTLWNQIIGAEVVSTTEIGLDSSCFAVGGNFVPLDSSPAYH